MKLVFIFLNLPGHLNPMTALARHLQARDHEVVFLYSARANGLPCVPGNVRDPFNENRPEVSKLQGEDALAFSVGLIVQRTESMRLVLLETLRRVGLRTTELARAQVATIHLELLKIGAIVTRNTRRIRLWLSSSFTLQELFCSCLALRRDFRSRAFLALRSSSPSGRWLQYAKG